MVIEMNRNYQSLGPKTVLTPKFIDEKNSVLSKS